MTIQLVLLSIIFFVQCRAKIAKGIEDYLRTKNPITFFMLNARDG
jgi:hypothetical protein